MQFKQRQLTRATTLRLGPDGLHVSQRSWWGAPVVELDIQFEELLPLRLHEPAAVAQREVFSLVFSLACVGAWLFRLLREGDWSGLDVGLWGYSAGLGLGLLTIGFLHFFGRSARLQTPRLQVRLRHRPRQSRQLRAFVETVEARAKTYLRQEYGQVNPLGHIEPQLRRVAWLRELGVLSAREARALTTRLTGQVPAAPLRSLGQELEDLFVN